MTSRISKTVTMENHGGGLRLDWYDGSPSGGYYQQWEQIKDLFPPNLAELPISVCRWADFTPLKSRQYLNAGVHI